MITVSVAINGVVIACRSAVNIKDLELRGTCEYSCDDGTKIVHNNNDGAMSLAMKMLKNIKEVK